MKNIGIITHNFPTSLKDRQNAGIFVNDIAQELAESEKVFVLTPIENNRADKIGKVKITNFVVTKGNKLGSLRFWNPIDILKFTAFFIGGMYYLPLFIKKNKISINIVMWAFPSGVFAYIAKKIFGIPYVVWCLGSDIYVYSKKPILKQIIERVLSNADFVFADGIDLAEKTTELSGKKCIFIPSATKASFKINMVKEKINKIVLTFVGRMESVKGPDILLEALFLVRNDLSKYKINFIGGGSLQVMLRQKAEKYGLGKQINFYGNVNDFQKISNVIAGSDWLVIPSRSDSIPLVFSEAMKVGTPIIASNLPDLKYLVNKYKVGVTFEKENFRQLANLIVQLPNQKKKRNRFSKNTIVAAGDFNINESARKIMDFINKI
ncbi:MAG: Glycosyl transferase group 1 [Candidatus Woesebacteria bacterium GW2011_GWB1_39_10]|uniref:Glycosyl transferase group 1 n=2 Tax=Candidatus Woeseibacteriota TaxID=1752722 RepID=A0A0G0PR30_9BACT|nr:MAG: Glycosyl transferase group 1 [Candidatus Woesebacteria bacterium GW2011_GWB1_39_10]KKS90821.1 MAG: Glycosyl transferase group 1 [Candidatus Woesebacteria bacterium GW2011_GWA1_43_12]